MESGHSIQIYVSIKHMGNIAKTVKKYPLILDNIPRTFRDLVVESVKLCVAAYKERAKSAANPHPITDEQFECMKEMGRFAFGVHYNENAVDESKAIKTAIDAVSDGLIRVFKDDNELTDLDGEINIKDGSSITFIRLTMLSGRMW